MKLWFACGQRTASIPAISSKTFRQNMSTIRNATGVGRAVTGCATCISRSSATQHAYTVNELNTRQP